MSWRRRIIELVLAGGTLAACGDTPTVINNNFPPVMDMAVADLGGACNANPDPCCGQPASAHCHDDGGTH